MAKKNKGGRPTTINDAAVAKLEYAFSRGLSDREACLFADVHPASLYRYCQNHPEFRDRKELLKEQPKLRAKLNIADKIDDGDERVSEWYLERKAKDEFSTKTEVDAHVAQAVQFVEDVPREDDDE